MADPAGGQADGLAGRVALVTGGARGIGRASAVALARAGCDVIAVDACALVDEDAAYPPATTDDLAETVRLVEAHGRRAVGHVADVRDMDALQAAVDDGRDRLGTLDVVLASAGVMSWGSLLDVTPTQWRVTMDTNVTGVWHTLRAVVPPMIEHRVPGSIVIVNSVCGLKGMPMQAHYVTAKHALVGLSRAAAVELGPHRIRVNSVHPWGVDTAMSQSSALPGLLARHPQHARSFESAMPPRLIPPEDIAALVVFLAGDQSRSITGQAYPVDRGALLI
ncbi:MAG: mycofactocin-coupled SDR family oxidoreductase [Ilumatobacteraceae bacterium]